MSLDSLDMLLDEYDEWFEDRAELVEEDEVDTEALDESDALGITLLIRLAAEVVASSRVLPHAGSATSDKGAPPILLATLDAMQAG